MKTYNLHFFNCKTMSLDVELEFPRESFTKREYDMILETLISITDVDHENMLVTLYVDNSVEASITMDWTAWMDGSSVYGALSLVRGYDLLPLRFITLAE